MRSLQVHRAAKVSENRFHLCRVVAKGVRGTHQSGKRMEDSIGEVLQVISGDRVHVEVAPVQATPPPDPLRFFPGTW